MWIEFIEIHTVDNNQEKKNLVYLERLSRKVWVIWGGRRESAGYLKGKCKVGGGKVWVSSLYGWLWFQSYGFSTKHGCLLHVFLVETKV